MLGFRPMKKQQQQQQPSSRPVAITRRRSSSPLPVIYEDHSKSHDDSSDELRNSHSSSSSSGSSSSSSNIGEVIWPPANSPTWPPRDDEPLISRWNDYGAVNAVNFDRYRRQQLLSTSDGDDSDRSASPQQQQGCFNRRLLQWTGSDVTEVTSNRMRDLHHNFTGSLSYSNSGTYNSDSHSFGEEYSFLNDSSFHRRQRIHPAILRIWHLLSVLVMIVFCSSLFFMPSILQQSENGEWGGDVHGQYHGGGKHSSVDKGYGGGNGGQVRSYRDGVYQDSREYQDNRGSDSQQQTTSWKYPKPWKYLFGMGNDDSNDVNNSSTTDSATAAVNGDGANASNFTASIISQDVANTNTATVSIDSTREQEDSMAASLSNVTFATLASIMLPPYLQSTIELCRSTIVPNHDHDEDDKKSKHRSKSLKKKKETSNKLDLDAKTTNILPSQVLTLRKQLLKTRDLIDVFSPVYPPNYNSDRYHPGDLNFETRDIKYAKFNFGLELEKDGKFREDSKVLNDDGGITMGEREMFGHDHGKDHRHGRHDNKQKHHDDKKKKYRLTKAKSSSKSSSSNKHQKDLWKTLRTYLDEGYTTLGQFQDLDHANIQYSQDTLEEYRRQVWEWHVDFMKWIQKNYLVVMRYLSHVCEGEEKKVVDDTKKKSYSAKLDEEQSAAAVSPSCQYTHTHSSHLFWGGISQQDLPDGNDILAHVALGRLGSAQLQRANGYLGVLWDKDHVIPVVDVDEPMENKRASAAVPRLGRKRHSDKNKKHHDDGNKEEEEHSKYDAPPREAEEGVDDEPPVHEVYHNLRKELRSFLDEVDLFGTLLLPDTMVRPEVITLGLASDEQVATVTNEDSAGNVPVLGEAEPTPPANITVSIAPDIGPQISPPVDPDPSSVLTAQSDDKQKTFEALTSLRQTRKLLGDLNDDYTAYTSYVEWDTNHGEQLRLMSKIYTEWNNFRWWAGQIGLSQQIDYLISRMMVDTASLVQDERVDGAQDPIQEGDDAAAVDSNESVDAAAAAPATDEAAPAADEEAPAPAQVRDDSVTNNDPESPALESTENVNSPGDLTTFLTKRKIHPTNRVVIGNDAGDADSIVSAIALSYVESTYGDIGSQATPIVSILRDSFEKERPEVNLLFELAGLHNVVDQLLYIEDLTEILQGTAGTHLDFTLVDQNTLNPALKQYRSKVNVVEIVDHHEDKGESIGTCTGANRTIAFDRGAALVASSCTLVAERLKSYLCNTDANCIYPESIATLLIGVILIDSVNLDQSIGKVTQRDRDAVVDLIQHTEWKPCESKSYVITDSNGDVHVDTGILFDTLQRAKYETSFWNSIAVERALPYDYKEFDAGLDDQHRGTFGIASILMSGPDFIAKEGFVSQTLEFMHTNQISFLAIMFAYYDGESGDVLTRQLGLCADQTIDLDSLMNEMLLSQAYKDASLDLKPVDEMSLEQTDGLQLYLFHQENVKPSRKQIGPMLEEVYGTYLMS